MRGFLARALRSAGRRLLAAGDRVPVPPAPARLLTRDERSRLLRNRRFRKLHRGAPAFVIGNGPSLAQHDLSKLAGKVSFVTNAFWHHPSLSQWTPTYYCMIDPIYFNGSPGAREQLVAARGRADGAQFFVPLYFHRRLDSVRLVEDERLLDPGRTFFLALGGDPRLGPITRLDPCGFLPPLLNVAQACVALALYMGCDPIYLTGMDHDWLSKRTDETHFYGAGEKTAWERGLIETFRERPSPYHRTLKIHVRTWHGYTLLRQLAALRGQRILNATPDSYLDVFGRVRFEDVVDR